MFKFEELCELVRLVGSSDVGMLEIEHAGGRLRIEGKAPVAAASVAMVAAPAPQPGPEAAIAPPARPAVTAPTTPIHQGAQGGRVSASSQPVWRPRSRAAKGAASVATAVTSGRRGAATTTAAPPSQAHFSHGISSATSDGSTVAPHQMRRPDGASSRDSSSGSRTTHRVNLPRG